MSGKVVQLSPPPKLPAPGRLRELIAKPTEDYEFLPAALEILSTPPSPKRLMSVVVLCGMLASALVWSWVAKLDIYAVASGRVQPSGRSKVVQPLEPGKIKAIAVANGNAVKAGDMIVELDATETAAQREAADRSLAALDGEIARRRIEIAAILADSSTVPPVIFPSNVQEGVRAREEGVLTADIQQYVSSRDSFLAQRAQQIATRDRFTASIVTRKQLIAVLQERYNTRQDLSVKKVGTRASAVDAAQQLDEELTNLTDDQGRIGEANAAAAAFDSRIAQLQKQTVADQAQKLTDALGKRDQAVKDLVVAEAKLQRTRLVAPITGTVQQLAVTTVGQVVQTGQALAVIVPSEGEIEVDALVPDSDVGFLQVGQEAVIKVDAFPFTRYGSLTGRVVSLSRDAVGAAEASQADVAHLNQQNAGSTSSVAQTQNLVYPVTVQLDRDTMTIDGKDIRLVPGMTVSVEVRTGDRRVIDYLFSPLREVTYGAGHER